MNILVPKSFKIKHEILGVLIKHRDFKYDNMETADFFLDFNDLKASLPKYDDKTLLSHLQILKDKGEIIQSKVIGTKKFTIEKSGANSYSDESYLTTGRKIRLDSIYLFLSIIVSVTIIADFLLKNLYEDESKIDVKELRLLKEQGKTIICSQQNQNIYSLNNPQILKDTNNIKDIKSKERMPTESTKEELKQQPKME